MLSRLLSHDLPRNRWLALALIAIVVALALTPFIFPGTKALNVAAKVIVFIVLAASFDLLLGYTGIVSFAHTMFFGIGAYGVAIAATRIGPTWPALAGGDRLRARRLARPLARHRPVQPARSRDLLRHDHARRRLGVRDARVAAVRHHRRRGRPDIQGAGSAAAGNVVRRGAVPGCFDRRQARHLLPAVRRRGGARADAAADRQLAVRPRPPGDPRERLPRRVDRLPHRRLPDDRERRLGAVRDSRRRPARALAALQRPRHDAVVRDHARRAADRRHRRHGDDLRRRRRQRAAGAGAELPAGPDEARRDRGRGHSGAGAAGLARSLAALARHPVRALGLLPADRRRRPPAQPGPARRAAARKR